MAAVASRHAGSLAEAVDSLAAAVSAAKSAGPPGAGDAVEGLEPLRRALASEADGALTAARALQRRLQECGAWASGQSVLTSETESECVSLRAGTCPPAWAATANAPAEAAASPHTLLTWLVQRCAHQADITAAGGAASLVGGAASSGSSTGGGGGGGGSAAGGRPALWLGGLVQPEAVLQGLRQITAASLGCPLASLKLAVRHPAADPSSQPRSGGHRHRLLLAGLAAEGFAWSADRWASAPSESASALGLGTVEVQWSLDHSDGSDAESVTLPLYTTTSRRRHLAQAVVPAVPGAWVGDTASLRGAALAVWFPGSKPATQTPA